MTTTLVPASDRAILAVDWIRSFADDTVSISASPAPGGSIVYLIESGTELFTLTFTDSATDVLLTWRGDSPFRDMTFPHPMGAFAELYRYFHE